MRDNRDPARSQRGQRWGNGPLSQHRGDVLGDDLNNPEVEQLGDHTGNLGPPADADPRSAAG